MKKLNNMRIGLYYGSFNPIHNGHISVAKKALESGIIDEVWLVVSPQNPLKQKSSELIDANHRLTMVEIAIKDISKLKSCDIEFSLPQPSYTHVSLEVLRNLHPTTHFTIIGGSDLQESISSWEYYEEILKYHDLLIYPRNLSGSNAIKEVNELVEGKTTHMRGVELFDVSATLVREHIKKGKSIEHLVSLNVIEYINENKLFKKKLI